jgi:hypothetical protein
MKLIRIKHTLVNEENFQGLRQGDQTEPRKAYPQKKNQMQKPRLDTKCGLGVKMNGSQGNHV